MSDQLAISATASVLMMAIYVLFGADVARAPIGPDSFSAPTQASTPMLTGTINLLPTAR